MPCNVDVAGMPIVCQAIHLRLGVTMVGKGPGMHLKIKIKFAARLIEQMQHNRGVFASGIQDKYGFGSKGL